MSKATSVSVTILGREYAVACDEQEIDSVIEAAVLLNKRVQEVKDTGKIMGGERVAVLAALNLTHEMLVCKRSKEQYASGVANVVQRLRSRLDNAIVKRRQWSANQ